MDEIRLRKLAGMETSMIEDLNANIKELDLFEKMYPGKNNLNIDTDQMSIEEVQKRMDAASRGIGLVNRLSDPNMRRKHLSRIMSNLNTIRAALKHMLKTQEPEELEAPDMAQGGEIPGD